MPGETEKPNTERVQELYDSFGKGDFEAIRNIMDPDVELHEPKGIAGGGTHHGFDEIVENVFSRVGTEWEDVSVAPERYVEDDDTVVVLLTWSGTSTKTGKSVEYPNAHVFDFEEGKIIQWRSYADTALFNAALEA
ncbi:nuclear transport factor 2 family protein [Natronosalvus halobius]|uniref:nuclear transport factor 2 family protein n=1 Tax=Natronosalvus halobius TaxID=2953746 RepID=UPI00209CE394|nr:nuclear transport factor 2 family protein [Natronosalvus halobius]USZ73527.1 nuclear transport factor 2 family protein [Natronosalvus halobius]